jgi:hypothetical protein
VQGKEGYYKTKVCDGNFDSGKLRGNFFLSGEANAVALLYRKKRREGKKREKMSSTKGSNVESLLHTVVYVYVYVLAGTGQGNIRTGYLLRLPLYLQAFLCYCVTMSSWKFIGI